MTDTKEFFTLAHKDDAVGLEKALGADREAFRIRNEAGESIYLYCVFRGRTKCADMLKARGSFSLHEAALAGDAARVASLAKAARVASLAKAAPWSVDALSPDGWTALHLAAFLGQGAVIAVLLEHDADARIFSRAMEQNLPIHAAAAGRRIDKTAYAALVRATGDANILQKQGYTALMIAAGNGFADAVDVLLAAGADKSLKTPEGKTAADFAHERGHEELANRLSF